MKQRSKSKAKGRLIGRLVDGVEYKSEHIKGLNQDTNDISDGYHTFRELYEHRIILFIALCRILYKDPQYQTGQKADIWRSKLHADGSHFDGWFILGIGREKGEQITYHLPLSKWDETDFAETREQAPEWDGHTNNDVLERLNKL